MNIHLQNSKFCIKYDENNSKLKQKIDWIKNKLNNGLTDNTFDY